MRQSFIALALLALVACDPGSTITFTPSGTDDCVVDMRSNDDGFTVAMTLRCAGADNTDCYDISALSCQGEAKPISEPLAVDDCPGAAWCVASCADGLDAPGNLWDIPALKAVDGCDTYAN